MTTRKSLKLLLPRIDDHAVPVFDTDGNRAVDEFGQQIFQTTVVVRGVIDPASIESILIDEYQREEETSKVISEMTDALMSGVRMPDIELGMRGDNFVDRDDVFYLQDAVYVIDGQQRLAAAKQAMLRGLPDPRIGCLINFNTDYQWEKVRFEDMNTKRRRVSANIHLRNLKDEIEVMEMLYNLCLADVFALKKSVSWGQRKDGNLITARALMRVLLKIHQHLGPVNSSSPRGMAVSAEQIMRTVGRTTLRNNMIKFFDLVDASFGLRHVSPSDNELQTKEGFLLAMAQVISDHRNFWKDTLGHEIQIGTGVAKKMKSYRLHNPLLAGLIGNSQGQATLAQLLVNHYNSSKRTQHLKPRRVIIKSPPAVNDTEEVPAEEDSPQSYTRQQLSRLANL